MLDFSIGFAAVTFNDRLLNLCVGNDFIFEIVFYLFRLQVQILEGRLSFLKLQTCLLVLLLTCRKLIEKRCLFLFTFGYLGIHITQCLFINFLSLAALHCTNCTILPICKFAVQAIQLRIPFECRCHGRQFIVHVQVHKPLFVLLLLIFNLNVVCQLFKGFTNSIVFFDLSGSWNIKHHGVQFGYNDLVLGLLILRLQFFQLVSVSSIFMSTHKLEVIQITTYWFSSSIALFFSS